MLCHRTECRYAECRCAERLGARRTSWVHLSAGESLLFIKHVRLDPFQFCSISISFVSLFFKFSSSKFHFNTQKIKCNIRKLRMCGYNTIQYRLADDRNSLVCAIFSITNSKRVSLTPTYWAQAKLEHFRWTQNKIFKKYIFDCI